jgi:DMSO/TMAO reductase YedYZ heme-binding membrane subunit
MSIDHTLSWEVARVGGLLAYLLTTVSVVLGLLLSLRTHSARWPRFITNELHRHVTLLSLVFIAVHTLAVWVDPFTGFNLGEVLLPMASHYRPLWIAFGIVGTYLAVAIWLSEYVRRSVGYAWWHRFHMLAFVVFLLGTVHGLGSGSDSSAGWAVVLYGGTVLLVAALVLVRAGRSLADRPGWGVAGVVAATVLALAFFAIRGPLYPGWNAVANNGNGNGESAGWLASHPTASEPPQDFATDLHLQLVRADLLDAHFDGGTPGELQLLLNQSSSLLAILFADGWSCRGNLTIAGGSAVASRCIGADGVALGVQLTGLQASDETLIGHLRVTRG